MRSLLKTSPLHQLRAKVGREAGGLCSHDDATALCMKALEVLVDSMGVRSGATRDEISDALVPLLVAGDALHGVKPSEGRHRRVIELVIGTLLNDADRRQAYSLDYLDFTGGRPTRRTMRFRLASEHETLDGSIVLRAEPDGVNLFLRSLDVELEDAQAATEAIMRSQIDRGRIDLALQTAREAHIRSVQFHDKVQGLLSQTRRDVRRVDWRAEVPKLIEEALEHLESRLSSERDMRSSTEENLRKLLGKPAARTLVRMCDLLDDCLARHLELQRSLMCAYEVFRREQGRQRFAPLSTRARPSLERDVFEPIFGSERDVALSVVSAFSSGVDPATMPTILDLRRLWERLLRPPPTRQRIGRALESDDELEELRPPTPYFDEQLTRRVDRRLSTLDEPVSLAELLEEIDDVDQARYTVLRALQHFAPGSDDTLSVCVEKCAVDLVNPVFFGDDVTLHPMRPTDEEACDA